MEAFLSQFTFLSDEALLDKNLDPSTVEDLMRLFEIEAYKSWAAMELDQENEVKAAEVELAQAEDDLDSVMDEFRWFEQVMERTSNEELSRLEETAKRARKMGNAERYTEVAGISSNKVHPN